MKKVKYYTQTVLFQTNLFGKDYFWMQDVDGTIYLLKAKAGQDGKSLVPDLTG